MRTLLGDVEMRRELAAKGRPYVAGIHDAPVIAAALAARYEAPIAAPTAPRSFPGLAVTRARAADRTTRAGALEGRGRARPDPVPRGGPSTSTRAAVARSRHGPHEPDRRRAPPGGPPRASEAAVAPDPGSALVERPALSGRPSGPSRRDASAGRDARPHLLRGGPAGPARGRGARGGRPAGRRLRPAPPGRRAEAAIDGVRVHRLDVQRHQGAGIGTYLARVRRVPRPGRLGRRARHRRRRYARRPGPHPAGLPRLRRPAAAARRRAGPPRPPRGDAGVLPEPLPAGRRARSRTAPPAPGAALDRARERRPDRQRRASPTASSTRASGRDSSRSSPNARPSPGSTPARHARRDVHGRRDASGSSTPGR